MGTIVEDVDCTGGKARARERKRVNFDLSEQA